MSVFVKICGLTCAEDVESVAALRPDAIGFVFWSRSKRFVRPEDVAGWTGGVPESILKVGVFVDAGPEDIRRVVQTVGLQVVQLHGFGEEGVGGGLELGPDVKVWQVVHLARSGRLPGKSGHVDAYLVDSYSEQSPGGTGETCDWNRARDFAEQSKKPVVLAGGLKPANVQQAIKAVRPWGVDVSSGVEISPGRKDVDLVKDFIEQCRS